MEQLEQYNYRTHNSAFLALSRDPATPGSLVEEDTMSRYRPSSWRESSARSTTTSSSSSSHVPGSYLGPAASSAVGAGSPALTLDRVIGQVRWIWC